MKEELMEDIRAELNHLIGGVLRKEDVKRIMELVRKLYEKV